MADESELIGMWRDCFVDMVNGGDSDPASIADAMLTTASLLVAQHRGDQAAIVQMMAGLNFLTRRQEQASPESGGLH